MGVELNRPKSITQIIFEKYKKVVVAFILIILLFVLGEIILSNFLRVDQVLLTLKLASFTAFFALCQMIVISAGGGGLDLSVGYMATMTAVFTASIMDGQNGNLWIAVIVALAFGVAVGLSNGLLTAYLKLPPLVVTMAMANILQGIINVYTAGRNITGKPSPVLTIIAAKSTGSFPNVVFILIVLTILVMIVLNKTKLGMILFGVGSNERTAYLSGFNVKLVRCIAFTISGVLASLIGLLLIGNMGIAFKDMGSNYVMPSIAAAVVGGVSLSGGDGNYFGVILGAIFLQTLTNLLIAMGWGDAGKWLGFGIVLFALLIVYVSNRRTR
ncbi:MAG TPA: ABC transporter permease [Atribacter sp.]|jgi:ribose transport system permease protein|uniref:Autoinducer 2 import system permease protein LsrD n=1 Tax=Candidatus Atribacter allofermentans TaxID=1852833 RepID=A0A1V5SJA6_9BACT|nr:ABC transporter permease [Atribacter sp.]MDD3714660.1 ABC transporter permease [Atribacterota bacterium]OQA54555.1 MAG: Ribose transport system permease protein RbsC [Candidatus Atribacteria bacterium ADurb.Bin276]HHT09048.1 ABC transporter permease [Candidatus Atribacteria bacterium]MDI9595169.1 ABC transporter permease [Atribacterota bacterium]HQK83252.1 ABC transporter permease [Atribacter sp.]